MKTYEVIKCEECRETFTSNTWKDLCPSCEEKLSENQKKFIKVAGWLGLEVDYTYSGRGMFGRTCPSVQVESLDDFYRTYHSTQLTLSSDNLGMNKVIYASR